VRKDRGVRLFSAVRARVYVAAKGQGKSAFWLTSWGRRDYESLGEMHEAKVVKRGNGNKYYAC
jgi:hypothetical protein